MDQKRQNLFLQHITANAALEIATLAHDKAKKILKDDPTNDQKRFQFQDAIGRLHRAKKSVWMSRDLLPK
jgi:hypothetical protein